MYIPQATQTGWVSTRIHTLPKNWRIRDVILNRGNHLLVIYDDERKIVLQNDHFCQQEISAIGDKAIFPDGRICLAVQNETKIWKLFSSGVFFGVSSRQMKFVKRCRNQLVYVVSDDSGGDVLCLDDTKGIKHPKIIEVDCSKNGFCYVAEYPDSQRFFVNLEAQEITREERVYFGKKLPNGYAYAAELQKTFWVNNCGKITGPYICVYSMKCVANKLLWHVRMLSDQVDGTDVKTTKETDVVFFGNTQNNVAKENIRDATVVGGGIAICFKNGKFWYVKHGREGIDCDLIQHLTPCGKEAAYTAKRNGIWYLVNGGNFRTQYARIESVTSVFDKLLCVVVNSSGHYQIEYDMRLSPEYDEMFIPNLDYQNRVIQIGARRGNEIFRVSINI